MPDFPTISGGPGETASNASSSRGVTVFVDVGTNAKDTWVELIAATAYDSDWILIGFSGSFASDGVLIDIGVGAATSEVEIIKNLYVLALDARITGYYTFPLRIPRGTRVSARAQAGDGISEVYLTATVVSSGVSATKGLNLVETIGANVADSNGVTIDPGGTANTDVIGELTSATSFAYHWMCLALAVPSDTDWGGTRRFLVDVVQGSGGSEVQVVGDLMFSGNASTDCPSPPAVCFPCNIAAGQRVAARVRCNSTASERVVDIVAYGVG